MKIITKFFVLVLFAQVVSAQTVGLKVISNGDVGVGTATPLEKLDVDGAIKIGTTSSTNPGTIRFTGNCFEGYDGSSWVTLGGSGCIGSVLPTCMDGIQNQGETGVDCGGPCAPCSGSGCATMANIDATRPLSNLWWDNEFNVGGTAISGDGELFFTIDAITGLSQQVIGLNYDPDANAHYTGINYGIYFYPNTSLNRYWYIIRENGVNVSGWTFPSSSIVGIEFSIERSGTSIIYKNNGVAFYTSSTPSSGDLYFDNSFYYPNSGTDVFKIKDVSLCPSGASPFTSIPAVGNISPMTNNPNSNEQYAITLSKLDEYFLSEPTPNPIYDRATVTYSLSNNFFEAEIIFTDSYSRELGRQNIVTAQGEIEVDSSDLGSGLYQYSLVVDGQIVKTNKMVVVK